MFVSLYLSVCLSLPHPATRSFKTAVTRGGIVAYGDPDSYDKAYLSLDRNHTHFILVDDGTVDKFDTKPNS